MVQGTFYHVPEHVIFSQVSYESHGFDPDLPKLSPFPLKDVMGQCVAFSMLVHYSNYLQDYNVPNKLTLVQSLVYWL